MRGRYALALVLMIPLSLAPAQGPVATLLRPVVRPLLSLEVSGPRTATTGKAITLRITIGNHTPLPMRQVRLRCELGQGLIHPQGREIWADLGELAPGQVRTEELSVRAERPGGLAATLSATAEGNHQAVARTVVEVRELPPALRLDLTTHRINLVVGEETWLETRLYNAGPTLLKNVRLALTLPENLTALQADGPTRAQTRGAQVDYDAVEALPPRTEALYRVRARATRPGTARVRAGASTAGMERPVEQELSAEVRAR